MQSSWSKAWASSKSLLSVLVPVRCADRAFQVPPISRRRLSGSMLQKVVMPMARPVLRSRTVKGTKVPAACLARQS